MKVVSKRDVENDQGRQLAKTKANPLLDSNAPDE
jgi:hypothetical protein